MVTVLVWEGLGDDAAVSRSRRRRVLDVMASELSRYRAASRSSVASGMGIEGFARAGGLSVVDGIGR